VQVHHGNNVEGRGALARRVEADVEAALGRFGGRLTGEVHLGDENAGQGRRDRQALLDGGAASRPPARP